LPMAGDRARMIRPTDPDFNHQIALTPVPNQKPAD